MSTFNSQSGQSLLDVCLNTYGTFDLLLTLLTDNGISDIDQIPYSGQPFSWDESLTSDEATNIAARTAGTIYSTEPNAL